MSCSAAFALDAIVKSAVNVRSGPGVGNGKVTVLLGGQAVTVTECRGGWCYVQHSGPDGWVSKGYLILGAVVDDPQAPDSEEGAAVDDVPTQPAQEDALAQELAEDACKSGYVWREAAPDDHVCVRPTRRAAAQRDNLIAKSRVDPAGDAGPNSCRGGFVWREAYTDDVVCVSPDRREQVQRENSSGPSLLAVVPTE